MHLTPHLCLPALVLGVAAGAALRADDCRTVVNRCLTRSSVVAIDGDGRVEVKAPDRTYRFNLKEAGINVNAENGDARLRIATASPFFRENFMCRDLDAAREAMQALNAHRAALLAKDGAYRHLAKRLDPTDPALTFGTLGEAVTFTNDRLSISPVSGVDAHGMLTICGTDGIYRVDLRKAEFSLNDRGERAKVRIYGDWALEKGAEGRGFGYIARESFSAESTSEALKVVKALYVIKAAFAGQDPKSVLARTHVDPAIKPDVRTLEGATDALNTKLAMSRIVGIDGKGVVTINGADHLYRFDLARCSFDRPKPGQGFKGWIESKVKVLPEEGIVVKGDIKQFSDPQTFTRIDEVILSTETYFDTQDALALFKDLQARFAKK